MKKIQNLRFFLHTLYFELLWIRETLKEYFIKYYTLFLEGNERKQLRKKNFFAIKYTQKLFLCTYLPT